MKKLIKAIKKFGNPYRFIDTPQKQSSNKSKNDSSRRRDNK